jgi:hypothetical protein
MSGQDSYEKGKAFEQQVASFMQSCGWKTTLGRHFYGKIAVRSHDCDIFAKRTSARKIFAAVLSFLYFGVGVAYWCNSLTPYLQSVCWSLNVLAPLSLLVGVLAVKNSTECVWIECKNLQQSIKRDLVIKLNSQFRDAVNAGSLPKFCRRSYWLVSTSRFDEDAIAHAKAHGVSCYRAIDLGSRKMALREINLTTGDL